MITKAGISLDALTAQSKNRSFEESKETRCGLADGGLRPPLERVGRSDPQTPPESSGACGSDLPTRSTARSAVGQPVSLKFPPGCRCL
jgi:hypothetical protein